LFDILIWVFLFPLKITELLFNAVGVENNIAFIIVAGVIGFFSWSVAFKIFDFIFKVFKRSPL